MGVGGGHVDVSPDALEDGNKYRCNEKRSPPVLLVFPLKLIYCALRKVNLMDVLGIHHPSLLQPRCGIIIEALPTS
jgi:hypothetical protein